MISEPASSVVPEPKDLRETRDFDAFDLETRHLRRLIDARLGKLLVPDPGTGDLVRQAMHEAVMSPGKRLRPMLALLAARDLDADETAVLDAGCALEMVHTASLILDDLPCMDDAALRRGNPSIHVRFGQDIAILAAVALLSQAFGLMAAVPRVTGDQRARLVTILSDAVGVNGLVGGQYADLRSGRERTAADIAVANDRKTGSLFTAALDAVCVIGCSDDTCRKRLREFARELGQAFQILDDILDMTGDADTLGKDVQQDRDKATLIALVGMEGGRRRLGHHVSKAIGALKEQPRGAGRLGQMVRWVFGEALEAKRERAGRAALG
ncbi:polyprenyl synthetase family protein [Chthonobacter rhizosphaerae]|uniref:polyprenyl synthetase family protein n=1 Tax=Chthonobacter rhizosphaerae TaxID=2735553 RepID=UPI0015EFA8E1|nr:polyprenyl synthetase family protein [Chthonobacter rhizosphaerae]